MEKYATSTAIKTHVQSRATATSEQHIACFSVSFVGSCSDYPVPDGVERITPKYNTEEIAAVNVTWGFPRTYTGEISPDCGQIVSGSAGCELSVPKQRKPMN